MIPQNSKETMPRFILALSIQVLRRGLPERERPLERKYVVYAASATRQVSIEVNIGALKRVRHIVNNQLSRLYLKFECLSSKLVNRPTAIPTCRE